MAPQAPRLAAIDFVRRYAAQLVGLDVLHFHAFVPGGASSTILPAMTLPVLMAH